MLWAFVGRWGPSKHDMLNQYWFNGGQRRRRWANFKPILVQRIVFAEWRRDHSLESPPCWKTLIFRVKRTIHDRGPVPANTRHSPDVGSMLVRRLRRWPNIEPTLGERPAAVLKNVDFPGKTNITIHDRGPVQNDQTMLLGVGQWIQTPDSCWDQLRS